jgi:hypothetical protein
VRLGSPRSLLIALVKNWVAAYRTSRICAGVPQFIDGRCWNTPSESASPQVRLFMCDSTQPASKPASITRSDTWCSRPTW